MICETKVYQLGRYTVRQQPHFDNPAFPQFLVFIAGRLVGKQFSVPCESDCDWLARQNGETRYAQPSKRAYVHSTGGYHTKNATKPAA